MNLSGVDCNTGGAVLQINTNCSAGIDSSNTPLMHLTASPCGPAMKFLRSKLSVLIGVAAFAAGCSSSVWRDTYVGTRGAPSATMVQNNQQPVVVRSVPWDRVWGTLQELERDVAASAVYPDEWSPEQRDSAKSKLLTGLQVSEPPSEVTILGRCEFRTTGAVRPESPRGEAELIEFAREIGADTVVWSGRYFGKVEKTVQEPVTTFSSGIEWERRGGRNRPSSFTETSTTWVPVRMQFDELGYIAYFLRRSR